MRVFVSASSKMRLFLGDCEIISLTAEEMNVEHA